MRVRSDRKDSERLQQGISWRVLLEEGWCLLRGHGHCCPQQAAAVGMEQGTEQEYVLQLAVCPGGLQFSELYPLLLPMAQADWPLEGLVSPWSPPGMAGSMLPFWGWSHISGASLVTPQMARTRHVSAGDRMLMDLRSAVEETACAKG